MGLRPSSKSCEDTLVTKYIGTAYDNVKIVADNIDDVNTVALNIGAFTDISDIKYEIKAVGDNINDVVTVANNIDEVVAVSGETVNIAKVGNSIGNVNVVAGEISVVNKVSGSITSVNSVASNIAQVNDVADNIDSIVSVSPHTDSIDTVADNITDVITVNTNITEISNVADNITNVELVGDSINGINELADNIDYVKYGAINFVQEEAPVLSDGLVQGSRWYKPSIPEVYTYYINTGDTEGAWIAEDSVGDDTSYDNITDGFGKSLREDITEMSEVTSSLLIAQGLSGSYGFFADGFSYVNEGDVGISTDNKIYKYVGVGAPAKEVSAGINPSGDADYEVVVFNELPASNVSNANGGSVQGFIDKESNSVSEMLTKNHEVGEQVTSGMTRWLVTVAQTPLQLNNFLYVKPVGAIYLGDFKGGTLTDSESFSLCAKFNTEVIVNGDFTVSGIEILEDNARFTGLSGLVSIVRVSGDETNNRALQFGKIKSGDTRSDNLPVYNGLVDYWDENEFSPADSENPRISNSGIRGCTIIVEGDSGVGVSFYRTNDCFFDCHVKFENSPVCGNSVRGFMNKNMNWGCTTIDSNLNSTYSFFSYWSYSDFGEDVDVGASQLIAFELKHPVQASFNRVIARQDAPTKKSINIGYGALGVHIGRLVSEGGVVDIHSSKEFETSNSISIDSYNIVNEGFGLGVYNLKSLALGEGVIDAFPAFVFASIDTYTINANSGITPVQNSAPFVFDGNYDSIDTNTTPIRYFERRPIPSLIDCDLGKMTIKVGGNDRAILGNVPLGLGSAFAADGKYLKEVAPISGRAEFEAKRYGYNYANDFCNSIKGCTGDINIQLPDGHTAEVLNIAHIIHDCNISIRVDSPTNNIGVLYGSFGSSLGITTSHKPTSVNPILEINTFVDSEIHGTVMMNNRGLKFKSAGGLYRDGFTGAKVNINYVYPDIVGSSRINITDLDNVETLPPLKIDFSGSTIRRLDSGDVSTIINMLYDEGEVSTGEDNGAGWVGNVIAQGDYVRRAFSSGAGIAPPYKPRFIGEKVENTNTGVWWIANSRVGFVEM